MILAASKFKRCAICGQSRKDILNSYHGRKNGPYYLDKFCRHLTTEHSITLQEYCERHLRVRWPLCPVSGEPVGFKVYGRGLLLSTYKKGVGVTKEMSNAVRAFAERMSIERRGKGNPMYRRPAWNKFLPIDHPYRKAVAARKRGLRASHETRLKMHIIRMSHLLKARHIRPHTEATKARLRRLAAERHARRVYNIETLPHCALGLCLSLLGVPFAKNHPVRYYCLDIALPEYKVGIEADGDFFHCNPAIYPAGPQCAIQRRNSVNDKAKNSFLRRRGWILLRYWESDIFSHGFVDRLRADLVKHNVLAK